MERLRKISCCQKVVKMRRYEQAISKLEDLMQGEYESPTAYGKRAWRLFLQIADEDSDESWVVENFIAGIDRCEFRLKLQAEYGNKAMSLDAAIRRLEVLECKKAKVANRDSDSDRGGYCKRGLVPVERGLSYYRAWRKAVDLVQKEGESGAEYYMRARDILPCLDPEDECWLVNAFLNGLINDSFQRALDKARRANKSMTLLQAYEQLEIMAAPVTGSNIDFNCSAGFRRVIAVEDVPGHILVDPVAFRKFLVINNLQPIYQGSGHYSEESIQILHHEFSQLTEEETTDVAPLMKASAKIALLQQKVSWGSHYEFPQAAANPAISPTQDNNEAAAIEPVPMSPEAFPSDDNLSPDFVPNAAVKPVAIENGTSGDSVREFVLKPEVWGIVGGCMKSYQNMTGEKKVDKWREKDGGQNEGEKEKDVSTMDLGMEMNSFTQGLVDSGWKVDIGMVAGKPDGEWRTALSISGERESWTEEKHETTEKPENSNRPRSAGAIQNPSVLPIRTASEWEPGPEELDDTTPATKANTLNGRQWFGCWKYYGHCKRALWKIGGALIGGSDGNRVWDPGGGRAESLSTAGRWRKSVKASGMGCDGGERVGRACREASIWVLRCLWSHGDVVASCRGRRCLFVWACGEK